MATRTLSAVQLAERIVMVLKPIRSEGLMTLHDDDEQTKPLARMDTPGDARAVVPRRKDGWSAR